MRACAAAAAAACAAQRLCGSSAHLVIDLAKRLLGELKGARRKGRDLRAEITEGSAMRLAVELPSSDGRW